MEEVAECTRERARTLVLQLIMDKEPIREYALACLSDEARMAASGTLQLSILDQSQVAELKYITGTQLHNLYAYYRKCAKAATALASTASWISTTDDVWFNGTHCVVMQESSTALEGRPHSTTVTKPELIHKALKRLARARLVGQGPSTRCRDLCGGGGQSGICS